MDGKFNILSSLKRVIDLNPGRGGKVLMLPKWEPACNAERAVHPARLTSPWTHPPPDLANGFPWNERRD